MIIGVSGFKSSGKDTVANYLVEKYNFKRISFADPLKDMVAELFDVDRRDLDNPKKKECSLVHCPVPATDGFTKMISEFMVREFRTIDEFPPDVGHVQVFDGILHTFINNWEPLYHTPRSLAILLGSSMRSGKASFWVDKAIFEAKKSNQNVVISDLRYRSECQQLTKEFGKDFITIRLNRFDSSPSTDPSELDLVGFNHDFEVENKGTQEELFRKIEEILNVYV